MKTFSAVSLVAGFLGVAAVSPKWTATLEPVNGSAVRGFATVQTRSPISTDTLAYGADVTVSSAQPGKTLTWRVQNGSCDRPGAVVGNKIDYPVMNPGPDGRANASAKLSASPDTTREYSVAVFGKTLEGDTVVSCGDLHRETLRDRS